MEEDLIVTKTFDAGVEKVWNAVTVEEKVKLWWGPNGFSAPIIKIDFKVGGKYLYCMRASPEMAKMLGKTDFYSAGEYKEIVPNKKLVVTDYFSDENGNIVPATYYGMSKDFALKTTVTMTFEEKDGKTTLTIRYPGIPAGETMEQARQGWMQSLDKLAKVLQN